MQVPGVATYQATYATSGASERSTAAPREGRAGATPTIDSLQAGDSVSISPQARTKAGEEKNKREVAQLRQDEERVKAHEAAHKAAGGQYTGSVSYSYKPGPDGRSYVVGGEVQIDVAPEQTAQETISKMEVVIRAAMAPSDPSGQDRAVAAQAASQMAEAQQQRAAEVDGEGAASVDGAGSTGPQSVSAGQNSQSGRGRDEQARVSDSRTNRISSQPPFSIYA